MNPPVEWAAGICVPAGWKPALRNWQVKNLPHRAAKVGRKYKWRAQGGWTRIRWLPASLGNVQAVWRGTPQRAFLTGRRWTGWETRPTAYTHRSPRTDGLKTRPTEVAG